MPRYRITIEYDGTPFSGWQIQPTMPSVQGALIDALERMTGSRPQVTGAGRTDAGVHALGQVAHFDLDKAWLPGKIRDALNFHLRPHPIAVLKAEQVSEEFHARFSAAARHYRYVIFNRRADDTFAPPEIGQPLKRGMRVRVGRDPYMGYVGRVSDLTEQPVLLANGLRLMCAKVDFPNGESVQIPLANLELAGR